MADGSPPLAAPPAHRKTLGSAFLSKSSSGNLCCVWTWHGQMFAICPRWFILNTGRIAMLACQICHILWCWIFRTGRHPALKLRIVCRNMDNNCPYCILVAWGHVETLCPHLLHACWEQNASQPLRSSLWVFGVPKGVPALHQKDREKHGCWEHHGGQLRTMRRFVIKDHGKICRVFWFIGL